MLTDERIIEIAREVMERPVDDGKPAAWQLAEGVARAIEAEATAPLLARIAELEKELAQCRDAFPVPDRGTELESLWAQAMGAADSVSAYVKAQALSAAPAAQPTPITEEMVTKAARALCKCMSESCQTNEQDAWAIYGSQFRQDAEYILKVAHGIKEQP